MSPNAKVLPPQLADLLGQATWARRLARSLVGSEGDDVVQDTWLAAMRRPPDTSKPIRPWLGTVIRNRAFNRSRDGARRLDRETRAEAGQAPEPAEVSMARLEVHKILVDTVGALPEPYRQTVLLAYFEGLSSREIGDRQNVPPGTVRGRLKTALDLLREALDSRLGGRGAWLASAVDLAHGAGPSMRAPAHGAAGGGGASSGAATTSGAAPWAVGALPAVLCVVAVVATGGAVWKVAHKPSARTSITEVVGDDSMRAPSEPSPSSPTSSGSAATAPSAGPAQKISTLIAANRDQLRRYPAISTRPFTRPPPRESTVSQIPASSDDRGPCTVATKGESAIAKACSTGGRANAKKLMKQMVKQAKANGQKFTCDGCHEDLDRYQLTKNANDDYAKLDQLWNKQP